MKRILLTVALALLLPSAVYASQPQVDINLEKQLSISNIPASGEKGLIVWVEKEDGQTLYTNLFSTAEYNDGVNVFLPMLEIGDSITVTLKGAYNQVTDLAYDETLVWADFKAKYDAAKESEIDGLLADYNQYIKSEQLGKYLAIGEPAHSEILLVLLNSNITSFNDIKDIIDTQTKNKVEEENNNPVPTPRPPSGGGAGVGGGSYNIAAPKEQDTTTDVTEKPEVIVDENEALKIQPFNDSEDVIWAKDSILLLKALGIVSGDNGNMFYPQRNVTRAEFLKMLVMTFDEPDTTLKCTFDDVSESDWFHDYIALAQEYLLAQGSENKFSPNSYITRQDAAVLIWRFTQFYKKNLGGEKTIAFSDSGDVADYAKEAIENLVKSGIMSGMDDGQFMPLGTCNRAMAAQMIANVINAE